MQNMQELQQKEDKLRGKIQHLEDQSKLSTTHSIRSGMLLKSLKEQLDQVLTEKGRITGKPYTPPKRTSVYKRSQSDW